MPTLAAQILDVGIYSSILEPSKGISYRLRTDRYARVQVARGGGVRDRIVRFKVDRQAVPGGTNRPMISLP